MEQKEAEEAITIGNDVPCVGAEEVCCTDTDQNNQNLAHQVVTCLTVGHKQGEMCLNCSKSEGSPSGNVTFKLPATSQPKEVTAEEKKEATEEEEELSNILAVLQSTATANQNPTYCFREPSDDM